MSRTLTWKPALVEKSTLLACSSSRDRGGTQNLKTSLLQVLLVLSLLAFSSPTGRAQMQPPTQAQGETGLPDFSGFNLIDSFARLPAERTNLSTLCDVRRTSIDEITSNIEGVLPRTDESSDPAAAVRLHNAMGVVFLYKGDVTTA